MLHQILTTEYLFWLVVLLFYVIDSIKLTDKNQVLIRETITGRFKSTLSLDTFDIRGKQAELLNLLSPFTGFIKLDARPNENPSNKFENCRNEIMLFQSHVFPFKAISIISFSYLLLGPILTFYHGLGASLIIILPVHLSLLFVTLSLLLLRKKKLGLNYGDITSIFFDCLVVPAYLVNIVRKIYNKKSFSCDGYYFLTQTVLDVEREELEYKISKKIGQLAEQVDENQSPIYFSYKKLLGIKDDQL